MAKPGPPKGSPQRGGRKAGTPNKRTVELQAARHKAVEAALLGEVTPLDVMRAKMNNELIRGEAVTDSMFQAAVAAAPYVHARLQATTLKGDRDAPLVHEIKDDSRAGLDSFLLEFSSAAALQRDSGSDGTKH